MLVILLENINKIGKMGEVKKVNDGYANNFLFPKNLAKIATPDLIKKAEVQKAKEIKAEQDKEKSIKDAARQMEGKRFIVKVKAGDEGQLFEGVNSKKIIEKIIQNGFEIEEKQLLIEKPIKELGEFKLKVKFNSKLESTIIVVIEKEK